MAWNWATDVEPLRFLNSRDFVVEDLVISHKDYDHDPNEDEWEAIIYLCHEWDYSYDGPLEINDVADALKN